MKAKRNLSDTTEYLTVADETCLVSHRSQSWNANVRKAKCLMVSKEPEASSSERDLAGVCRAAAGGGEDVGTKTEAEKRDDDAQEKK